MSGTTFSKLPVMIVALVIGLILTFTAVMPLVSSYSDDKTFTNDGYYRLSKAAVDSSVTIVWDHTDPDILTVNGEDLDMSNMPKNQPLTIYASEEAVVRYTNGTSEVSINRYGGSYQNATESNGKDVSITLNGSSATMVWGASTDTLTSTGAYYIDPEGDYTMKKSDITAKVSPSESILLIAGTTNINGAVTLYGTGTIEDGLDISVVAGLAEGDTYSIGDVTINYTESDKYADLADLTSIQFPFTKNTTTTTITYSYFVVPYEITASTDQPEVYKNLVSVLPLFALILLVAGAASLVYFKNKD